MLVLYNIIKNFRNIIFTKFRVDVLKYPSLSSLSLAILRCNFLGDSLIPLINGEMFNFLKQGYTGGAVDVVIPRARNVSRYDVNSLYPFVMKFFPMPVGSPTYFEGDISKVEKESYGIFEVEVTSPPYMKLPILQLRMNLGPGKGSSTVAPLGN